MNAGTSHAAASSPCKIRRHERDWNRAVPAHEAVRHGGAENAGLQRQAAYHRGQSTGVFSGGLAGQFGSMFWEGGREHTGRLEDTRGFRLPTAVRGGSGERECGIGTSGEGGRARAFGVWRLLGSKWPIWEHGSAEARRLGSRDATRGIMHPPDVAGGACGKGGCERSAEEGERVRLASLRWSRGVTSGPGQFGKQHRYENKLSKAHGPNGGYAVFMCTQLTSPPPCRIVAGRCGRAGGPEG